MLLAIDPQSGAAIDQIATLVSLCLGLVLGLFIVVWLAVDGTFKLIGLNSTFNMATLGVDRGKIRLDEFTIRAGVRVSVAKWYLNSKTRQLNGIKEVNDLGDVVYLFGDTQGVGQTAIVSANGKLEQSCLTLL